MNKSHVTFEKTQRGATLILALLILVMIMMYGIPAAMNSIQNERMTGNTRQRDLAFQAAEHAIKKAETWINTETATSLAALAPYTVTTCSPANTDPNTADCVFPNGQCHTNDVAYWQTTYNWAAANVCTLTGADVLDSTLVFAQPRYIVERMPDALDPSSSTIKPYYRITARGVGKDSGVIVILQTMYRFN
jgi:type IV pilus assembly protein PilX